MKVYLLTERLGAHDLGLDYPDPVNPVATSPERAMELAGRTTMSRMALVWRQVALPPVVENRRWLANPVDTAETYEIHEMDLEEG